MKSKGNFKISLPVVSNIGSNETAIDAESQTKSIKTEDDENQTQEQTPDSEKVWDITVKSEQVKEPQD